MAGDKVKNYAKAGLAVAKEAAKVLSTVNPSLPEPTLETFDKTFIPALGIGQLRNQFVGMVINAIGEMYVAPRMAKDALADIRETRSDMRPFGEIYVEDAELIAYGNDDVVKGEYAQIYLGMLQYAVVMNFLGRYQCTTGLGGNFDMIVGQIFNNLEQIGRFAETVANVIETTYRIDSYTIFHALLTQNILDGGIYTMFVDLSGTEEEKYTKLIKAVKKASMQLESNDPKRKYTQFGNRDYVPKEDQMLVMGQTDIIGMDVDVLAGIFNMSKDEFDVRRLVVDEIYEQGSRIDEVRRVNPNIKKLTLEESNQLKAVHAVVSNKRLYKMIEYIRMNLQTDINSAMLKNVFTHIGNHFGLSPLAGGIAIVDSSKLPAAAESVEYTVAPLASTDPRVVAFQLTGDSVLAGTGINLNADNGNMMNNIVCTKKGQLMLPSDFEGTFYLYGDRGDENQYISDPITVASLRAGTAITFTKR